MTRTRWGEWSFERRDDEIADVAWGATVVLRSVRAVVRDHDWATGTMTIDRIAAEPHALVLHVRCIDLGADIHGTVRVAAEGSEFSVAFDAESRSPFSSNRVGLVVLHPHRLAGVPLTVGHTDSTIEETAFPRAVSPRQPVCDIRTLQWRDGAIALTTDFSGDTFEMEDQRNWTDASFKTYSRPLALPFPYDIAAGQRIVQEVRVSAVGSAPDRTDADIPVLMLHPGGRFPQILLGAASAPDPAPAITPVGDGVLVELDLASTNWRAALARAASTGQPLDVRLTLPAAADAQWGTTTPGGITDDALAAALDEALAALTRYPVLRIGAFDPITHVTEPAATLALRAALSARGRAVAVLRGSRSHFTELNREQERLGADAEGLTFALTPLFHTLDDAQLRESVAVQRVLARQASTIAGGRPVHIGPITLRPRFNNVATVPEPGPSVDDLRDGYGAAFTGSPDARQSSSDLAAWTVASAAALSVPGVGSLAFHEQWGPRGVRTVSGEPLPVATAVSRLAALSGTELLCGDSPDGLLWAVGGRRDGIVTVLAANLDSVERALIVRGAGAADAEITLPAQSHVRVALPPPPDRLTA